MNANSFDFELVNKWDVVASTTKERLEILIKSLRVEFYDLDKYPIYWHQIDAYNAALTFQVLIDYFRVMGPKASPDFAFELDLIKTQFLYSLTTQSQSMWFGLSGSDDLGWGLITLTWGYKLTGNPDFIDFKCLANGARGA